MAQKLLVAVSGGIDSVVLLDILARHNQFGLVVAHFDHGIRLDSADDARFVEALAAQYRLPFVCKREELGKKASEELARTQRYAFLQAEAAKQKALVATAHHSDDVIESIAINCLRGTGWRGLAVLDRPGVVRPLLYKTKAEIRQYALENRLEWVEDSTNAEVKYLRNRMRRKLAHLSIARKLQLRKLRDAQCEIRKKIDKEAEQFINPHLPYSRYFFTQIDSIVAYELLQAVVVSAGGKRPTRPQTDRALLAIKTANSGAMHDIGSGARLSFTRQTFVVEIG